MVADGFVLIILLVSISFFIYNKNDTVEDQEKKYITYDFNDLEKIKSYDINYLKTLNDGRNPTIYYNEDGLVKQYMESIQSNIYSLFFQYALSYN